MNNEITIKTAEEENRAFIFELSPRLAEVAGLPWHSEETVQKMQDEYMTYILDKAGPSRITLIAVKNSSPLGFIHVRAHEDGISGEVCGTVPLLAVSPKAQGMGVGKLLMESAQRWAKEQGYRLLHLEVFANNTKAQGFYKNLGFEAEMLHMIKVL
jgi:ribosomal protein S18 acetylase RimI-like enzyme